jgi:hypothetical protein
MMSNKQSRPGHRSKQLQKQQRHRGMVLSTYALIPAVALVAVVPTFKASAWRFGAVTALGLTIAFVSVSWEVPDPYMVGSMKAPSGRSDACSSLTMVRFMNGLISQDEIFHVPQAQLYCRGTYDRWDPSITTPPGLCVSL